MRIFEELPESRVEWAYDRDEGSIKRLIARFPTVKAAKTLNEILKCPDVHAVVVATPAVSHYEIALKCLEAGKHVLVEKPIALTVEDSRGLIEASGTAKKTLMVGHTFLFNPGIRTLKKCVNDASFGKLYYLHATRTNMGPIRSDVNAVWDLAPHDVSIFNYILGKTPEWVSATGARLFNNGHVDLGFLTIGYPDNIMANIHVSWADPYKVREVVAVGSRKRVVFDDLENVERVKVFEKGVTREDEPGNYGEFRLLMRDGDIISPRVDNAEPLKEEIIHFLECVKDGRRPSSDGLTGLEVVKVMLAADESIRQNGTPVAIQGVHI